MLVNQLRLLPTDETKIYLAAVFQGTPLELSVDEFSVEVISTLDAVTADPTYVAAATAVNLRIWYDTYFQRSSLILSLQSNDLNDRCIKLHEQEVVREFYDFYNPYLVLKRGMPPLSANYRSSIFQIANALCANERPLYFSHEYVTEVDLEAPPDFEYNTAMAEERGLRRNG